VEGDVVPGEAHHADADELEIAVARRIPLVVAAAAVELEAVELNGELLLRPIGVDLVCMCLSVDQGIEDGSVMSGAVPSSALNSCSSGLFRLLGR
jgi:hypothetical protein